MHRIASRLAILLAPLALAACRPWFTEPLFDQGQIDDVVVFAWPNVVEVGDTITAYADAYKASGTATAWSATRDWRVSDGTIVEMRAMQPGQRVLLGALRPGTARVYARVSDHEGSDTVRVIPRLAPITFTPSIVSMRRGDSARAVADIRTTTGDPVTGVYIRWNSSNAAIVATGCCSTSTWLRTSAQYGLPGSTTVTATVGHATGSLPVTVLP
jgi:hypothetical protein